MQWWFLPALCLLLCLLPLLVVSDEEATEKTARIAAENSCRGDGDPVCFGWQTSNDNNVNAAAVAKHAVNEHPNSHIEMAMTFVSQICPAFVSQSNDNLVVLGRSLENLVKVQNEDSLEQNLHPLIAFCQTLSSSDKQVQVPKVRFGRTELQMPILSLGCSRFTQEWGRNPRTTQMNQVGSDCQDRSKILL